MKYYKRTGYEGTLRTARDENKKPLFVIGTVEDFLKQGIFESCDYNTDTWCAMTPKGKAVFGKTKEDAENLIMKF